MCEIFGARAAPNDTTPCDASVGLTRTGAEQGGYQMAALGITLLISIVGGTLTGSDDDR